MIESSPKGASPENREKLNEVRLTDAEWQIVINFMSNGLEWSNNRDDEEEGDAIIVKIINQLQ